MRASRRSTDAVDAHALAVNSLSMMHLIWGWAKRQLHSYRELAPILALGYAYWRRRAAASALREGRIMHLCTVILVDVDGLRRVAGANASVDRVTVPTLFSRTLRTLMFDNEHMVELVSEAARRTTREAPLLELGTRGWLVMANINAHLMETCCAFGHAAAVCGHDVEIVEVLYGLVHDRTTTSRDQLRVYVVKESQLRALPAAPELDLGRGSRRNAYSVLCAMANAYEPPMKATHSGLADAGITTGLPSGMGRTWLVFPKGIQAGAARPSIPSAL